MLPLLDKSPQQFIDACFAWLVPHPHQGKYSTTAHDDRSFQLRYNVSTLHAQKGI
jgi:hypothetical protein